MFDLAKDNLTLKKVMPGQQLVQAGDLSSDVFFVMSGRLLAVKFTKEGREIVYSTIRSGDYFGELAAMDEGPRSLSVYSVGASEVWIMPASVFNHLMDQSTEFKR